jgi:hypothetical protein
MAKLLPRHGVVVTPLLPQNRGRDERQMVGLSGRRRSASRRRATVTFEL